MTGYQKIIVETRGKVQIVRFNQTKRKNAMDATVYLELTRALQEANENPQITTVAITGTGDFYSSGNDIKAAFEAFQSDDPEAAVKASHDRIYNLVNAFITFEKLLIAVINGPCIGIAFTTAVLCDVVYSTESAYFQAPFTTLGLSAEGCSSITFPRIMGTTKAAELLLLSEKMTAEEGLQYNVISRVFENQEEMNRVVWPLIEGYSELPRGSLKTTKSLMRKHNCSVEELQEVNKRELEVLGQRLLSDEVVEATMNFLTRKSKM